MSCYSNSCPIRRVSERKGKRGGVRGEGLGVRGYSIFLSSEVYCGSQEPCRSGNSMRFSGLENAVEISPSSLTRLIWEWQLIKSLPLLNLEAQN